MKQRNNGPLRPDIGLEPCTFEEGVDNIRRIMAEERVMLLEISAKLDAIMAHLGVPPKPPAGFVKE